MEHGVLARLVSIPDGERRITNLLHLGEVLHQVAADNKLGMTGVLKWLSEQRSSGALRLEEHQLRLESDENALKLVTVHKSKGLEYPVVFCPFAWDGCRIKKSDEPLLFHDAADHLRATLDLGSAQADANRAVAEKELLAENIRLLYVALTRAKNRCYFVWGKFKEAETSAPAYLLHYPEAGDGTDPVGALACRFESLTDADVHNELNQIAGKAGGFIQVSPAPDLPAESYTQLQGEVVDLTCRKFRGSIDGNWRVSSFSSLLSGHYRHTEPADRDELLLPEGQAEQDSTASVPEEKREDIFSFPRGTAAGILLHEIFEQMDFTEQSGLEELVADKLNEHRFESKWLQPLCGMIRNVLSATLDPLQPELRLGGIRQSDRLNELEFFFPLKQVSKDGLRKIFNQYGGAQNLTEFPEALGKLSFSPTKGFMKGFIDLVFQFHGRFYLVDWKSNFLGTSTRDYHQDAIWAAMVDHMYVLQYHIYAVALHQYLTLRLPGYSYETHFGGVFYLFLRGVDPELGPEFGIYRDRPSPELIRTLCAHLIGPA